MSNDRKPKYLVIDVQEGKDVLGKVNTLEEVKALCGERVKDTDGDCYVVFYTLNDNDVYSMESPTIATY